MEYCLDLPARSVIGADARTAVAAEAQRLDWPRVLLVSDPYLQKEGRVAEIAELLKKADITTSIYTGVTAEPDTEMVTEGLEQYRQDNCNGVVALGGGSPIDTAKTIAVMVANDGPVHKFMALNAVPKPGVGVIAIPTTAGTGSETTVAVVIGDKKNKIKMSGRDRSFVPVVALVDYKLTMTMPPALTAAVGVDALTHAIEAYVSKLANLSTDPFALSAINLIWNSIRNATHDGSDQIARKNMMLGSYHAGIAFSNASVALVHGMSEPIGACFHVPHGLSNAMLLPAVTKFSADAAPQRYAQIARFLQLADPTNTDQQCCSALIDQLFHLNRDLKLQTPAEFGINQQEYDGMLVKMSQDTIDSGCTKHNPVVPDLNQTIQIYRDIFD